MAIKRINPSRNSWDNEKRASYGYVIKVPKLPDAHEYVKDFVVYNQADNCFYKCVEVTNESQHYFTWKAVTYGADRPFLVPVGKLTTTDALASQSSTGWTDKHTVEAIAKTLNEIVFGMRRYRDVTHEPLGYTRITGNYASGVDYYVWKANDTLDVIGLEAVDVEDGTGVVTRRDWKLSPNKSYTGDFYLLVSGTAAEVAAGEADYVIGAEIPDDVYTKDPDVATAVIWGNVTMEDIAAKANELADRFNDHGAGIPVLNSGAYGDVETINNYCATVNLIVEEVNPFSIPWQLLLNRQNFLETEVGAVTLQGDLTQEQKNKRTDLASWKNHVWHIYNTPLEELPELLYGSVVQAVDSALKLIRFKDVTTGNYTDLDDFDNGTTLVAWLNALKQQVDELTIIAAGHGEGLDQIWKAVGFGEVGYVVADNSDSLTGDTIYYTWNSEVKKFDVISADSKGDHTTVGSWRAAHGNVVVYKFMDDQIARNLINANAQNILINKENIRKNKQLVDDLLGTSLYAIYIEKLDEVAEGEVLYHFDRTSSDPDHPFIPFTVEDGDTLESLQDRWNGPIFVRCLRSEFIVNTDPVAVEGETYFYFDEGEAAYLSIGTVPAGTDLTPYRTTHTTLFVRKQTAAVQIRVNNEEIARLNYTFFNDITKAKKRVDRLKQLTGVSGDDADETDWNVDGYVELTGESDYHDCRRYYRLDPTTVDLPTKKFIEMFPGTAEEYDAGGKWVLTKDEWFREDEEYYTREWVENLSQYEYTRVTPTAGAPVVPGKYYVWVEVSYVVPYYKMTSDSVFQAGKRYFAIDSKGNYVEAEVAPGATIDLTSTIYYEYVNPTPRPSSGVYIRKARKEHGGYEDYNTHRGLIDRNTKDIEQQRQDSAAFQLWTKNQLEALEDFILSLMMSTLDIITQERSTLSLLHETVGKFIAIHNALERLEESGQTYKAADGIYDSGYDYYMNGSKYNPDSDKPRVWRGCGFFLTEDTTFVEGKTYYTRTGKGTVSSPYTYTEFVYSGLYKKFFGKIKDDTTPFEKPIYVDFDEVGDPSGHYPFENGHDLFEMMDAYGWDRPTPDGEGYYTFAEGDDFDNYLFIQDSSVPEDTYYEWYVWYKMRKNQDYEVGLEVAPNVYTKDLVIATTENYTINDIRMAVNRCLDYHIKSHELQEYTELPETDIILESMTYFRYIDDEWEEIHPELDDPSMIGQRVKDYDPDHKWYIHTGSLIPDGKTDPRYTETPVRMFLNELIKLHRRPGQNGAITGTGIKARTDVLLAGLTNMPSSTYGII